MTPLDPAAAAAPAPVRSRLVNLKQTQPLRVVGEMHSHWGSDRDSARGQTKTIFAIAARVPLAAVARLAPNA
jgi:hypothetical protein